MSSSEHMYSVNTEWTGNRGSGTSGYTAYGREYSLGAEGKADICGSADAAFLGDPSRWNPEELLLGSISACHQLWYLHLCADAGITVQRYVDRAVGKMDGKQGRFIEVVLNPQVTVGEHDDLDLAEALHQLAHEKCFIANSLNFSVYCQPAIRAG